MGDDFAGALDHLDLDNGTVARDFADCIASVGDGAQVLASFRADPWTGMDGSPAIVANRYGEGRTVYVGCRLDHRDVAASLTAICEALGFKLPAGDAAGDILRVERVGEDGHRFEFLFNRTHHAADADVDGETLVASLARVTDGRATIDPNGVVVIAR